MNIVKLGDETPKGLVNDGLVEMLECLVESAKSGDIVGLAYAATDGDDVIKNGWESGGHNLLLSASIAGLAHSYQGQFFAQ